MKWIDLGKLVFVILALGFIINIIYAYRNQTSESFTAEEIRTRIEIAQKRMQELENDPLYREAMMRQQLIGSDNETSKKI